MVIEAKVDKGPWHPDVVEEAFGYASYGFPFFATCNPERMILFATGEDPFKCALGIVYYRDNWAGDLFDLTSKIRELQSLYPLLLKEGIIDAEAATLYSETLELEPEFLDKVEYEPPTIRLIAVSGPDGGHFPREMGRDWSKESALSEKARLESNEYRIKVQIKEKDRWVDLDDSQTTLDAL